MATDDELPRAIIERVLSASAHFDIDVSIALLQTLADSLTNVIGEHGFESLLYRTVRRVGHDFPWLQYDPRTRPADPEFELFRLCFAGRSAEQVRAASSLLFGTMVDILARLVGVHMTTLILNSALGHARAGLISKEQHDG